MSQRENLLQPPPTALLREGDDAVKALLAQGSTAEQAAAQHPSVSRAWAELADLAWREGHAVESYAYARVGYHRGLDALRRAGWRGAGPVPWAHEPNQGFLRSLAALGRAAEAIGETDEYRRCATFLRDCDPEAARLLG